MTRLRRFAALLTVALMSVTVLLFVNVAIAFAADGTLADDSLSLSLALTAAGATIVAGFITGIVEILSRTIAPIQGHEQGLALVLAGLVVISAIWDAVGKGLMQVDLPTIFAGVVSWYGIARVAMGIHDDVISRNDTTSLGTST